MGPKLYNEIDINKAAKTAQSLDDNIDQYRTPEEMTNPVLSVLTQVALECRSATEVADRLNNALDSVSTDDSMSDKNLKSAERRAQVISDYGNYIEHNPLGGAEIRDVSELPYPKEEILSAILSEIVKQDDENMLRALKFCVLFLSDFQEGVGPKPIYMFGFDLADVSSADISDKDKILEMAMKTANYPGEDKYELFKIKADRDMKMIQKKILGAEELKRNIPEWKKCKILGTINCEKNSRYYNNTWSTRARRF